MTRCLTQDIARLLLCLLLTGWASLFSGYASAATDCSVPRELKSTRPDADGAPTRVAVGTYLIDLRGIENTEQSFSVDIYITLSWKDPRLVSEAADLSDCVVRLDDVWHPNAQIVNERSLNERLEQLVTIDSQGTAQYFQRYLGEFTAPLLLKDFPFDRQRLGIEIVSAGFGPDEVALVVDEERTGRSEVLSIAEWTVGATGTRIDPLYFAPQQRSFSRIFFEADLSRKTGFYLWKVLVPLSLIVFMSWAVFWIDPVNLAPQIGVSTSAILTLIAFQFSLGYMLPRLSYLTRVDRFVMGSELLVFLAFGESILTSQLACMGRGRTSRGIDYVSRLLFPVAFVLVLAISFWF